MIFKARISVFGGRIINKSIYDAAVRIGIELAKQNYLVFCGGGAGVMEAVSKGVNNAGGTIIGILKENTINEGNPYLSIPIATGMDIGRNVLLAYNCDAAIAISGQYGTMSEIAYAMHLKKPVIGYKTLEINNILQTQSPDEVIIALRNVLQ